MKYLAPFILAIISAVVIASSTVTPTPGKYVLRNPDNTPPPPFTDTTNRFDTYQACLDASKTLKAGRYKCDTSIALAVVSTCADEPAPILELVEKLASDGRKYWEIPDEGLFPAPAPTEANHYATLQYLYVKNTAANAYPNCWVRGFADVNDWELNPNYPNKPFMQIKGSRPIVDVPEVHEPTWHTAEEKARYDAFNVNYNSPENIALREAYASKYPQAVKLECGYSWQAACGGPETGAGP